MKVPNPFDGLAEKQIKQAKQNTMMAFSVRKNQGGPGTKSFLKKMYAAVPVPKASGLLPKQK